MKKLNLIDIHTHNINNRYIRILDISDSFDIYSTKKMDKSYISCGIHPWSISNLPSHNNNKQLQLISTYSKEKKLIAIGEIGLDLSCNIPLELQIDIFKIQLNIAIECNLPIIIHCVKAYSNFLNILKNTPKLPPSIIFHDFSVNLEVVKQLEKYNIYYSFGNKFLKNNKNSISAIKYLSTKKILFETDNLNIDIKLVYEKACRVLNISIFELSKIIEINFKNVFFNN